MPEIAGPGATRPPNLSLASRRKGRTRVHSVPYIRGTAYRSAHFRDLEIDNSYRHFRTCGCRMRSQVPSQVPRAGRAVNFIASRCNVALPLPVPVNIHHAEGADRPWQ